MSPAEIQRIVLLIGLAATGYLLILAWNDDYGPKSAPAVQNTEPPALSGTPEVGGDLPLGVPAEPGPPVAGADVPDASLIGDVPAAESPTAAVAPEPVSQERLVRVTTNSLVVWIDLLGGDIVRVQLLGFPVSLDAPDVPIALLDSGGGRIYVAQSGLIGPDGVDGKGSRPLYQVSATEVSIVDEPGEVVLEAQQEGISVRKVFRFDPDDFLVGVGYEVTNVGEQPAQMSLFAQLKHDGKSGVESTAFSLGPQPYLGAAMTTAEDRYKKIEFDDLDEATFEESAEGGWIAVLQHYFLGAWVANPEDTNRYYGQRRNDGTYLVGYTTPLATISPGQTVGFESRFFAGPKDQRRLEEISPNLNLTVDYGFLWWLAVPLFYLLDWLHGFVGNWGVAIIAMTIVVKAVLYPLSAASLRSMAKMRKLAPQMKRLQERHADDRQKLSQEMMALYQKEKANPLGGCLPMLLQMPVFIALYWVLFESVELRQAPFFLWIHDLAAMDPFFVLPILMGASMFVQQLFNPPMPDPMQARVMKMMPIMFTVLFLFFPAGLVLYWLTNNVLSVTQQWYVNRQIDRASS
jgi:YidC/Oxa1 family membrane protein insertase